MVSLEIERGNYGIALENTSIELMIEVDGDIHKVFNTASYDNAKYNESLPKKRLDPYLGKDIMVEYYGNFTKDLKSIRSIDGCYLYVASDIYYESDKINYCYKP